MSIPRAKELEVVSKNEKWVYKHGPQVNFPICILHCINPSIPLLFPISFSFSLLHFLLSMDLPKSS